MTPPPLNTQSHIQSTHPRTHTYTHTGPVRTVKTITRPAHSCLNFHRSSTQREERAMDTLSTLSGFNCICLSTCFYNDHTSVPVYSSLLLRTFCSFIHSCHVCMRTDKPRPRRTATWTEESYQLCTTIHLDN